MKRRTLAGVLAAVLLCLTGCSAQSEAGDTTVTSAESGKNNTRTLSYEAQYIRTDGYHEEVTYPVITVFRSREELDTYYEANKDKYYLNTRGGDIPSDSSIGFMDAVENYDSAFFAQKVVVSILVQESSGSVRHNILSVKQSNGITRIVLKREAPAIGTTDMAQWHILVELGKRDLAQTDIKVDIV